VLGGAATATFTLGAAATVTAELRDEGNAVVSSLLDERRPAGTNTLDWSAATVPEGRYTLSVTARSGTKSVTKTTSVAIDRTVSDLSQAPSTISPNGDGVDDSAAFSFTLAEDAPVRIDVELADGTIAATPFDGELPGGQHTISWDGTAAGTVLPDGRYFVVLTVTDDLGDVQIPLPLPLDLASAPP